MSAVELKACPNPWCKSAPNVLGFGVSSFGVACGLCGLTGPLDSDREDAITAWNTRPPQGDAASIALRDAAQPVFAAWDAHVAAVERMNAARPDIGTATRAEYEVYDERYRASEDAKRNWFAAMQAFVKTPGLRQALSATPSDSGERMREEYPGQRLIDLPWSEWTEADSQEAARLLAALDTAVAPG